MACILTSLGKILGRNRREKSRFGYNKEQIIRMGFGACYIILPRYIQKLGLLDESVFLMGEEALLGNQVYSNGGEILYTPQVKVIHQDHSTIAQEGLRAFKNTTILGYELIWNNLSFDTQCFVRLSQENIDVKIRALKEYHSQGKRNYLSEEFVYSLARARGVQVGCEFAEAFEVVRLFL